MPSGTAPRPKGRAGPETWPKAKKLLDLHLGARFLELLLNRRGFVLVDAFLDGLRRAIHQGAPIRSIAYAIGAGRLSSP